MNVPDWLTFRDRRDCQQLHVMITAHLMSKTLMLAVAFYFQCFLNILSTQKMFFYTCRSI